MAKLERRPFEKRWISPREAGEYLSLSTAGVYRLISQKKIPAVRVGHSVRVDLRGLEMRLQRQLEKGTR